MRAYDNENPEGWEVSRHESIPVHQSHSLICCKVCGATAETIFAYTVPGDPLHVHYGFYCETHTPRVGE
jgi:hypothetical protein